MTARVLTIEALVANTRSTDLVAGANMTSMSTTDTFTLTPTKNRTEDLVWAVKATSTSTLTLTAGNYPPAARQGLGDITITVATGEVRIFVCEATRVFTNAKPATIIGSNSGAGTLLVGCFQIPRTV